MVLVSVNAPEHADLSLLCMPDDELEHLGREYRKLCGDAEVLVRGDRRQPFYLFCAIERVKKAVDTALARRRLD